MSKHGKLDCMFNNAGIVGSPVTKIRDTEKAEFEKDLSTNVIGPFLGMQHAAPAMIPTGQGSIINTGSVASAVAALVGYPYMPSKFTVVAHQQHSGWSSLTS